LGHGYVPLKEEVEGGGKKAKKKRGKSEERARKSEERTRKERRSKNYSPYVERASLGALGWIMGMFLWKRKWREARGGGKKRGKNEERGRKSEEKCGKVRKSEEKWGKVRKSEEKRGKNEERRRKNYSPYVERASLKALGWGMVMSLWKRNWREARGKKTRKEWWKSEGKARKERGKEKKEWRRVEFLVGSWVFLWKRRWREARKQKSKEKMRKGEMGKPGKSEELTRKVGP
jgi:hypothetical protein